MKRWPTRFDLISAERQLAKAKREAGEHITQVRSAVRSRLTQPSTIFVVTGVGAVLGAWFARRNETRAGQESVSARASIVGILYSYLFHFGLRCLGDTGMRIRSSNTAAGLSCGNAGNDYCASAKP